MKNETILVKSIKETWKIAAQLAAKFPAKLTIALHGDLGAGKTCFVKGLASAVGIQRQVTSPTFTMINEYPGPRKLIHIDLYRINSQNETNDLGFEEYFEEDCILAIEWAEKCSALLPSDAVHVTIEQTDRGDWRTISIECPS